MDQNTCFASGVSEETQSVPRTTRRTFLEGVCRRLAGAGAVGLTAKVSVIGATGIATGVTAAAVTSHVTADDAEAGTTCTAAWFSGYSRNNIGYQGCWAMNSRNCTTSSCGIGGCYTTIVTQRYPVYRVNDVYCR